jgi:hypothetical protein
MVLALVDYRLSEECRITLREYGFLPISLPPFSSLEEAIRSHPDTLFCKMKDKLFSHEKYKNEANEVFALVKKHAPSLELIFTDERMEEKYPYDILFNCARVGNNLFGRLDFLSRLVKEEAKVLGYQLNEVKQGYAACSTCVIDEKSIITSDASILRAAKRVGIDALLIESGGITLPRHEYGFIGGASAVYGDTVFFFGNIDLHQNGKEIKDFIKERGKKSVSLSCETLADHGGILFI